MRYEHTMLYFFQKSNTFITFIYIGLIIPYVPSGFISAQWIS